MHASIFRMLMRRGILRTNREYHFPLSSFKNPAIVVCEQQSFLAYLYNLSARSIDHDDLCILLWLEIVEWRPALEIEYMYDVLVRAPLHPA